MSQHMRDMVEGLRDTTLELKAGAEARKTIIGQLERSKVSFTQFTWIIGILLAIWMGVQAVIWTELKTSKDELVKKIDSQNTEADFQRNQTIRMLGDLRDQVLRLEWRFDAHTGTEERKKK